MLFELELEEDLDALDPDDDADPDALLDVKEDEVVTLDVVVVWLLVAEDPELLLVGANEGAWEVE